MNAKLIVPIYLVIIVLMSCAPAVTRLPTVTPVSTDPWTYASRKDDFYGEVPIIAELNSEPECIGRLDGSARVLGVSDQGNWLQITQMGTITGWIPSLLVSTYNYGSNYILPLMVTAAEPSEIRIPNKNETFIQSINAIIGNSSINPMFICYDRNVEFANFKTARYTDQFGTYSVNTNTNKVSAFLIGDIRIYDAQTASPKDAVWSSDDLRLTAEKFAEKNSSNFSLLQEKLNVNFYGKSFGTGLYSYLYVYRGVFPVSEVDEISRFAKIEVFLDPSGNIISYENTIDFLEISQGEIDQ